MKRKIAAIFAANIAGYSRPVAEDEEETLRRLASYGGHRRLHRKIWRPHLQHRRRRGAGRIPERGRSGALRDRHPGKPAHPQHGVSAQPPDGFRIGITIGDVVERDGDLLGDGVNIAARLEGLAEVGGICVSRAVHEQVANKLSVQFADIGAQEVKNIPTPVHAYHGGDAARGRNLRDAASRGSRRREGIGTPNWMWPVAVMVSVSRRSASAAFCISLRSKLASVGVGRTHGRSGAVPRLGCSAGAAAVAKPRHRRRPRRRHGSSENSQPKPCRSSATGPAPTGE